MLWFPESAGQRLTLALGQGRRVGTHSQHLNSSFDLTEMYEIGVPVFWLFPVLETGYLRQQEKHDSHSQLFNYYSCSSLFEESYHNSSIFVQRWDEMLFCPWNDVPLNVLNRSVHLIDSHLHLIFWHDPVVIIFKNAKGLSSSSSSFDER